MKAKLHGIAIISRRKEIILDGRGCFVLICIHEPTTRTRRFAVELITFNDLIECLASVEGFEES